MAAVSGGESGMDSGCGLLRTAFPKKTAYIYNLFNLLSLEIETDRPTYISFSLFPTNT
jgi:hypothetical protein